MPTEISVEKTVRVSVRELVEFIMRSGSIDNRVAGSSSYELMQEGTKLHTKYQKQRKKEAAQEGCSYDSEVKLSSSASSELVELIVEGRADGVWRNASGELTLDEIKSTVTPIDKIEPDDSHWHFGQAKCYAHMLVLGKEKAGELCEGIHIRMVYINIETEEIADFTRYCPADELEAFFSWITGAYLVWMDAEHERVKARDASIKTGAFPYPAYRKGQREFAVMAYRAFQGNNKLFIEAPTGTGKTISALFPAVKAIGEGLCEKLFYLTAKTITRQAAENALYVMKGAGYRVSCVTLTAKEKVCINEPPLNCNPDGCPYADGHYDRANNALMDILTKVDIIRRDDVQKFAKRHTVCPHELQRDVSEWTDGVVCDYNYAFDPKVQLRKFFGEPYIVKPSPFVFLIDEAHNLVDRAREMFSYGIYKSAFKAARSALKGKDTILYRLTGDIYKYFNETNKNLQAEKIARGKEKEYAFAMTSEKQPEELYALLRLMCERAEIYLGQAAEPPEQEFFDAYFAALDFLRTAEEFDEKFTTYYECDRSNEVLIKLMCLDPSALLFRTLIKAKGSILFSATLTPADYFKRVLGGIDTDAAARLPSPFDRKNICVFIENRISTRYKDRESGYERVADCLYKMISARRGNYFAFFSSYIYLSKVYEIFTEKYPDERTLAQSRDLTEAGREEFLENFGNDGGGLLAFAVLGGVFSEGIDLMGDRLIGAAVVGVGLPLVSEERDVISRYYDGTVGSGFDYAYMFPGMNKVLQAAGRVIRSESDRGVVVLIDDRFTTGRYLSLFPYEWLEYRTARNADMGALLKDFWEGGGDEQKG